MYRPNFCAECGERITRLRWRAWTSRRFCDGCDRKKFRRGRIVWPLAACAALLGLGYVGGRAVRPAAPPLLIERGASNFVPRASPIAAASGTASDVTNNATNNATNDATNARDRNASAYGADGTEAERPTDPAEVVSICGARTKRGTPCSRRVRGTGRCWQHRGKAAMLPAAKLIVRD
ncbi:MAG TPA: hypothetical protein VK363_07230 [Pyrinomonadaceae bacterium]|nr:hypothetical protein [Pyrinomonadaceae bacterium]